MSLMKRYAEDTEELTRRGQEAACHETARRRMDVLGEVVRDCVKAASAYPDPNRVTDLLVNQVIDAYLTERKATVYRVAG